MVVLFPTPQMPYLSQKPEIIAPSVIIKALNKIHKTKTSTTDVVKVFVKFGQGWIRTTVHSREQIYSLSPLATRPPTLIKLSLKMPLTRFELVASPLPRECATPAPQRHGVKEFNLYLRNKPAIGIEPTTYGLQNRCSTVELCRHNSIVFIKLFYVKQYFLTFYKNSLLTC